MTESSSGIGAGFGGVVDEAMGKNVDSREDRLLGGASVLISSLSSLLKGLSALSRAVGRLGVHRAKALGVLVSVVVI